jgi:alkanesulfonate monooxygenase SsuD/methylene tetrahydromethanopterin reductase-like flavin-dependent oxidoreductase (luciferase family)
VCVDEDVELARRTLAKATLGYAMARPGARKDQGYRAHFARMGFDEALNELEARREKGAKDDELADAFPAELLSRTSVYGTPAEAAREFRRLAEGLDVAIVRIVAARPGPEHVLQTMRACALGAAVPQ